MAANYMTNELKKNHPDVPFAHVGDDTIAALTQLAIFSKTSFKNSNLRNALLLLSRPPSTTGLPL
jgi:hypothetical protein